MTLLPLKNWKILNTDSNKTNIDILLKNREPPGQKGIR